MHHNSFQSNILNILKNTESIKTSACIYVSVMTGRHLISGIVQLMQKNPAYMG